MALINRMSRSFTADVHAVLDRIEEPRRVPNNCARWKRSSRAASSGRTLEHEHEALGERQHKAAEAMLKELGEQLERALSRAATTSSRARSSSAGSKPSGSSATSRIAAPQLVKELAALSATVEEQREQLDVMRESLSR